MDIKFIASTHNESDEPDSGSHRPYAQDEEHCIQRLCLNKVVGHIC